MDPMLISAGVGLLGGMFGGGPSIPPEQKRMMLLQERAAKDLRQFSQGPAMSDPGERAALASQRALMGQQQMGGMNGLFANLGSMGAANPAAMMRDLQTQFQGQQSAIMSQHFLNSLAQRRNALLQSAQVAQGAVPATQQTQSGIDFGAILGPLAQQYGYQQGMKGLQQRQPGTVNVGGGGGAWQTTPYGSQTWNANAPNGPGGSLTPQMNPSRSRSGPFGLF